MDESKCLPFVGTMVVHRWARRPGAEASRRHTSAEGTAGEDLTGPQSRGLRQRAALYQSTWPSGLVKKNVKSSLIPPV